MVQEAEKRFHVSPQPRSRERVRAIYEAYKEISLENHDVVGFALTGSLSKGYDRSDSDIDLHVFYDPGWEIISDNARAHAIDDRVRQVVSDRLASQGPIEVYPRVVRIELGGVDNPYSPFSQAVGVIKTTHSTPDDIRRGLNFVSGFFGLDIGGGLKRYRRDFVETIETIRSNDPDVAEKVWTRILKAIKFTQRGEKGNDDYSEFRLPGELDRLYPNTLDELKKVYG